MNKRIYRARKIKNRRASITENPRIRSINKLLNYNFYISRYQRGYCWGKQEITDLLNDILHYQQILKQSNSFYCLQPVVVKKKSWTNHDMQKMDGWEVIDGQQRLTTILIILNYLETFDPISLRKKLGEELNFYTLNYETKDNNNAFLQNKSYTREIDNTNADFYHISKAYQYICEWFNQDKVKTIANVENNILNTLLDAESNVSVIWYEFGEHDGKKNKEIDNSSIDMFSRMNEGKVPFTDAELIKALLLQSDFYPAGEKKFVKQRLLEIAAEWDEIEAKLQEEKMWLSVNDLSYQPISRIEVLFEILSEQWNNYENQTLIKYENEKDKPKHFEFNVFDKHLKEIKRIFQNNLSDQSRVMDPINEIWAEVKNMFNLLDEWYNNHQLFHYIGFLFTINGGSKRALLKELTALKLPKDEFLNHIKIKIAHEISLTKKLEDLRYSKVEDIKSIIQLLLLMDIEAMVLQEEENVRFPFHLYKKNKIKSITHINPQTPQSIDTNETKAHIWLQQHKQSLMALKSIDYSNYTNEINQLLLQYNSLLTNFNEAEFAEAFTQTIALNNNMAEVKINEKNSICNLVLMDRETHNQLNTSFFDVKLNLLKENTHQKYIPINTRRVVTKYYSERPQEIVFWNAADRQSYFSTIKTVYESYVQLLSQHNAK